MQGDVLQQPAKFVGGCLQCSAQFGAVVGKGIGAGLQAVVDVQDGDGPQRFARRAHCYRAMQAQHGQQQGCGICAATQGNGRVMKVWLRQALPPLPHSGVDGRNRPFFQVAQACKAVG